MTDTHRPPREPGAALLAAGRFFRSGTPAADLHSVTLTGGREGYAFYRDRWSHDKVVHSTHGVNCTGSCRWKVYVKDGIITWETQETDYPSVGPDRPEYEPRGCPRGAAFSWCTYSPTRVRHPYVGGVLLEMYREAKGRLRDPVPAWADILDEEPDTSAAEAVGMAPREIEEMYRLLAIAKYEDRYVIPTAAVGDARRLEESALPEGRSLECEGGPGMGGDGPFGQDSGRRNLPLVSVENFHLLRRRQTSDDTEEA
ncbi:hypothetical protein ACIPWE_38345 [Streptomyces sp. NPDC090073]|uniref:hypothetical protein n=1 Tax=Streptomyces sp. NPDC090073 TaxID=3365936 RepID=UPI003829370B